jgi:hypothetical protein
LLTNLRLRIPQKSGLVSWLKVPAWRQKKWGCPPNPTQADIPPTPLSDFIFK